MSLLEVSHLDAFYDDFQALFDISLAVEQGQIVAIIGANGAGKSTFLRSVIGLVSVDKNVVHFESEPIGGMPASSLVKRGITMTPEGRRLFPSLNVEENLLMGAYARRSGQWTLEEVFRLFPILEERRSQPATRLSGGQQQMVAIGRALMSNPKMLLCDEISLGLAPVIVKEIYDILPRIVAAGTSAIIVEQDISQALQVADRVYCLQEGRVSLEGRPDELSRDRITQAYFGV